MQKSFEDNVQNNVWNNVYDNVQNNVKSKSFTVKQLEEAYEKVT
jgi:hypothetical protein